MKKGRNEEEEHETWILSPGEQERAGESRGLCCVREGSSDMFDTFQISSKQVKYH